ncbi:MAG: chemotaxis protein CheW [Salinivirgaceae bacterium]|jgi:purine-binding chemotaxis protein CheW
MSEQNQALSNQILVFTLDDFSYGIPIFSVVKVFHAVEIRPLPKAPLVITGVINVKGQIIPVVNIRKILGLKKSKIELYNRLILVTTGKRIVALLVDTVNGLVKLDMNQQADSKQPMPYAELMNGVIKVDQGLIFIYNIDKFLCTDDEYKLEQALKLETHEQ